MALLHIARRMDFVVEDHDGSHAGHRLTAGDDHGRQQVGRSIRAGRRGTAHRAGHHHRLGQPLQAERQHAGGVGHGVGTVQDHKTIKKFVA